MVVAITKKEELEAEFEDKNNKGKLILLDFHATLVDRLVLIKLNFSLF